MAAHPDLPRPKPLLLDKAQIFARLKAVDQDPFAKKRVLQMEGDFRARIGSHLTRLPAGTAKLQKFNTNPFVLMFYSKQQQYGQHPCVRIARGGPAGRSHLLDLGPAQYSRHVGTACRIQRRDSPAEPVGVDSVSRAAPGGRS